MRALIFILYVLLLVNSSGFAYQIDLFQKNNFTASLAWSTNKKLNSLILRFHLPKGILGKSNMYGFMLSNDGNVNNADALLIHITNSRLILKDMWTDEKGILHEDVQNDFHLKSFDGNFTDFFVSVHRVANTCHSHDYVIDSGTTNIISFLPYLENSAQNSTGEFYNYKVAQARKNLIRVQLLKDQTPHHTTTNVLSFDVLAPNTIIPNKSTTYFCSVHVLPNLQKIHGIGFEGIISPQSRGLVHHMEVFLCDFHDGIIPPFAGECSDRARPSAMDRCRHVIAAWAFGAESFFYPDEAGLPLGENFMSKNVRLEIHYNNHKMVDGVRDKSGIRIYYTKQVRPYDVGIIEIGTIYTPTMVIPPKQQDFAWAGICPSLCTEKALPREGIKVFGSELHSHLAGTKIWTSQYREGIKIAEISRDNHYTTWFEEIRHISPTILVLPGDALVTTCLFDTRNRNNVTFGGLGLKDEMCVNYLYYYPASNLEVCKSSVSTTSLSAFFSIQNACNGGLTSGNSHHSTDFVYNSIKWNQKNVHGLQLLYRDGPVALHCLQRNGSSWLERSQKVRRMLTSAEHNVPGKCQP